MSTLIKIRKAKPSDVNAIYWLRKRTFERVNSENHTPSQVRDLNEKNTHKRVLEKILTRDMFCLVKQTNGEDLILGTVDLRGNQVGGLFVRWNYLRRGCGSVLLRFIEQYAKSKCLEKVWLNSTAYARPFYTSQGYSIIGDSKNQSKMEKAL